MRTARPALLLVPLLAASPLACSSVWGFEDGTVAPAAGGSSSGGGGHGGDGAIGAGGAGASGGGLGGWGGSGTGGGCTTGQTEELGPCGNCGTLRRTCLEGIWAEAACVDEGECEPGTTSAPAACGNCGTQVRTCSESCAWGALGACTGEGACSPGLVRDCMCSTDVTTHCCGDEICNEQCQWDCVFKTGAECDWEAGYNWSCCSTPGQRHWCLSSCVWSTTCVAYAGC